MSGSGSDKDIHQHWLEFKDKFSKTYDSENEESKRKEIFTANFEKIQQHNDSYEKGQVTWKMGVNKFSDLTQEEFTSTYTGAKKN